MYDNPVIIWTLTAALLLGASYNVLQALNSHHVTGRINNSLHAIMSTLMAAMLWNLLTSTMLVQILILGGAALWFLIQAVARPQSGLRASKRSRIKSLYHSFTMSGATLMVAMMGHVTGLNTMTDTSIPAPMSVGHHDHSAAALPPLPTTVGQATSSQLALLLTIVFGAAAIVLFILLLGSQMVSNPLRMLAKQRLYISTGHGVEVLGAAVMAIMFATMAG